jgi:Zn-dependent protease
MLLPILLVSMMAHEVSHGYVAYRLGDPTAKQHGRLTANPIKHLDPLGTMMFVMTYLAGSFIFGWAKPIPVNPYYFKNHQRGMMVVGIAGPAANFAMAVLIALVLNSWQAVTPGSLSFDVLFLAYQVNVVLGIFNLVPIPPLDGSRLLGGLLSPRRYRQWTELDRYGMVFILVIFFFLREPFFRILRAAFEFVSSILLPTYF